MKALKTIGIILAVLVAAVLVMGLVAPKTVELERSVVIDAPREAVFPHLQYMDHHKAWSPWLERDPNVQEEIRGTDGTVGAIYYWKGNKEVGEGEQEITAIVPNERIETQLRFVGQGEANAFLAAADASAGTEVTWGFHTETPFPWNAMNLFMDIEGLVGKDYETGLNKLKKLIEEDMSKTYRGYQVQEMDAPTKYFIGVRKTVKFADMQAAIAEHLPKAHAAVQAAGIEMAGMPCDLYYNWDEANQQTDMAIVLPVKEKASVDGFETFEIPAGKALVIDYRGAYDNLGEAHYAMDDYLTEHSLEARMPVYEEYVTDPGQEPDTSKWLTKIVYPIK